MSTVSSRIGFERRLDAQPDADIVAVRRPGLPFGQVARRGTSHPPRRPASARHSAVRPAGSTSRCRRATRAKIRPRSVRPSRRHRGPRPAAGRVRNCRDTHRRWENADRFASATPSRHCPSYCRPSKVAIFAPAVGTPVPSSLRDRCYRQLACRTPPFPPCARSERRRRTRRRSRTMKPPSVPM